MAKQDKLVLMHLQTLITCSGLIWQLNCIGHGTLLIVYGRFMDLNLTMIHQLPALSGQ